MEVRTFTQNHKEVTLMINSNERVIKHKIGLLNLAEERQSLLFDLNIIFLTFVRVIRRHGVSH